jgi:2-methylcitrate dehydratase PrpD
MGARNGVTAAIMAQMEFSGVWDVFDCEHNVLQALSTDPKPGEMVAELGSRYFITETAIKPFSVGYPIQAPLDAFLRLRREHGLTADNVERIVARLPEDGARIVNERFMPDINCQHLIALSLVKGAVSFEDSHSFEMMTDPKVRAAKERVQLVADPKLMDPAAPRSGLVEVTLRDGRTVSHFTRHAPGTKENPMDTAAVNAKAQQLLEPMLGAGRAREVIERVNALEAVKNVRELGALLARGGH